MFPDATSTSVLLDARPPWSERLVARKVGDRQAAAVAARTDGELSTVVVAVPAGSRGSRLADALSTWSPARLRVEAAVLAEDPARDVRAARAAALEAVVEEMTADFVVVPTDHHAEMDRVPELLVHMWVEGADVGLMGPTGPHPAVRPTDRVARRRPLFDAATAAALPVAARPDRIVDPLPATAMPADDTAARVAAWLGLSEAPVAGRAVVVRRWVARWLFGELDRAVDPGREFAERARMLGLGVVELVDRRAAN